MTNITLWLSVESVIIYVICIAIIWTTKILSRRYSNKLRKLPIPGELFVVIFFTIFTTFFEYAHKIEKVGEIPAAFPNRVYTQLVKRLGASFHSRSSPTFSTFPLPRSLLRSLDIQLTPIRKQIASIIASSISNIFGSFFFLLPTTVSLSRTSLQASAGEISPKNSLHMKPPEYWSMQVALALLDDLLDDSEE